MKIARTLFSILLLSISAEAQVDRESRGLSLGNEELTMGPKLGINVSDASFDDGNTITDSRARLRAGVFIEIGVSKAFSIQPELLYSAKGYEFGCFPSVGTQEDNLNYLSVPIIAKYAFVDNGQIQVTGQAGPYLGFLLSAESGGNDISSNISGVDIGGQVGVGAAYSAGPGSLTLDVRAGFGFTDINDGGGNQSATNQVLPSATVGYAFSL